jgi:deoxyribonuclease-4
MRRKPKSKSEPVGEPCLLGAHFSIAKGLHGALHEAKSYECNVLQIFTKNASTWRERTLTGDEIEFFRNTRLETKMNCIASHTSYLINLAAPDKKKHVMSCHALTQELIRSSFLDIPYVVLHPGSHMGKGEQAGIDLIAESVNAIFDKHPDISTRLLFETTAGQGSSIGYTFEQLAAISALVSRRDKIGFCLDSCHIFAAGYDIRTDKAYQKTIDTFDATVGLKHLYAIHLNDSKKGLGSRVDRHEHIGEGSIGIKAFEFFMKDERFSKIPKIIETPKQKDGKDADRINLNRLRLLV